MEVKFNITKEERKAFVTAVGEVVGMSAVYKGAPSFAYVVNNYTIDKNGKLIFDERTENSDVRVLLATLMERGFMFEGDIDEIAPVASEPEPDASATAEAERTERNVHPFAEASDAGVSVIETPDTLVIEVPLSGFTPTALDNLDKLVTSKRELIMKAIGIPISDEWNDLPIERTESALRFPWFPLPASKAEIDAYSRFVNALCELAKKQKRVTMKDSDVESEKFAMRCFLLRLGFIGDEYKSARRILLSKLSGNGSFKSGDRKKSVAQEGATSADDGEGNEAAIDRRDDGSEADSAAVSGEDAVTSRRCDDCQHQCYYTDGLLQTSAGEIVDTSKRTPDRYTHYCLGTPSGFRKIKHATDWSGFEMAPSWCPLNAGPTGAHEGAAAI